MTDIIERYKNILIQIATPFSTGVGFYLKEENLIIASEYLIRDSREVIINGSTFKRCIAKVIYIDPVYNLAFLKPPGIIEDMPNVLLGDSSKVRKGEEVIVIDDINGQLKCIISNPNKEMEPEHLNFIEINQTVTLENSGHALFNQKGEIIGIISSLYELDEELGYALQIDYLKEVLKLFKTSGEVEASRCFYCANLVFINTIKKNVCPHCENKIQLPSQIEAYEPKGISKTIEILLQKAGYEVGLSRRGNNNWEIRQGSAKINILYYEKSGLILGDAYLCTLPKQNIKPLYEYLLKQNYEIESLTFSVKDQDIVLSLLIFDRYLNVSTGMKLFTHLIEKADYYDNILVEQFGANWKTEDKKNHT